MPIAINRHATTLVRRALRLSLIALAMEAGLALGYAGPRMPPRS